jgi:hypothetical protein
MSKDWGNPRPKDRSDPDWVLRANPDVPITAQIPPEPESETPVGVPWWICAIMCLGNFLIGIGFGYWLFND